MFHSSSHFEIRGGNFTEIRGDVNLHLASARGTTGHTGDPLAALEFGLSEGGRRLRGVERNDEQDGAAGMLPYGLHILYRAAAGDATHDAEDRFPQPKCHPETREKMLAALWNWTSGTEPTTKSNYENDADDINTSSSYKSSSSILWLQGPAGAGKSAIAQTLCHTLEEKGRLGASFFFKRGHPSRGHAKRLIATIAYQLALRLPDLSRHISWSVETDPSVVDKSLSIQLQRLIVDPWLQSDVNCPLVVVVDGLDECEDRNVQQQILCLIGHAVQGQQLTLRFLVASRPEPHIREIFSGALNRIHCPVNIEQSFEDVRKYLRNEFARIRREHRETMATVGLWPCAEDIDNLVRKSSGYFIYVSTVIKFIDDKDFYPSERLKVIIDSKDSDFGPRPFAALDQLYTQILDQVHARPELIQVLTVVAAKLMSPPEVGPIEQLLELDPAALRLILRGLRSLIDAKKEDGSDSSDWSFKSKIVVHHASFYDFLQDPKRAGKFYVSGGPHLTDLCRYIFKAWCYRYEDHLANRQGHVSGYLNVSSVFKLIAALEPSSDLLEMLRHFNPDFLFASNEVESLLTWLKAFQLSRLQHAWIFSELHTIFNFSWEELRAVICSLRSLLGTEGDEILEAIYVVALDPTLFAQHSDSLLRDKTSGSLRVMLQILHGEVDRDKM
ncbi:NACHT domain-containing protein [Mycena venus]|uniref:NACHT domain-containing protein n=1 Tax=Mycena venus TaxID=2733690 RepID=A0A8H7CNX6_9AGAR|nr:NACHT domain-containing protein [Mycena venus]